MLLRLDLKLCIKLRLQTLLLFLKMLCYLVHERKLLACCWLKVDYSFLLSKGAATNKLAVSFKPPIGKLNTRLDILLVGIFSAELRYNELKRLLLPKCIWDLTRNLGVSCKQPDLDFCVLHRRCSTLLSVFAHDCKALKAQRTCSMA